MLSMLANSDANEHGMNSIQFHTSQVHFFQPLIHDELSPEASEFFSNHVVRHALNGLKLLGRHRALYSSHFATPLHAFCLVHICDALIRYLAGSSMDSQSLPRVPAIANFCLETLEEMRPSYPLATALQAMFRQSLTELQIPLSTDQERKFSTSAGLNLDDSLNACLRPTYKQPAGQILSNMEDNLATDFMHRLRARMEGEGRTRDDVNQERSAIRRLGGSADTRSAGKQQDLTTSTPTERGRLKGKGKPTDIDSILNV